MPQLTVEGLDPVQVPYGKRLVLALEDDVMIDALHACGGHGRCGTCLVEFIAGEPVRMTPAERATLARRKMSHQAGLRLACQISCCHDMELRAVGRLAGSGHADSGPRPDDEIPTVESAGHVG